MGNDSLAARQRLVLAIGALLMLATASMFQCASLSIAPFAREALTLLAAGLALLCASVLIEDVVVRPAREALRLAWASLRAC